MFAEDAQTCPQTARNGQAARAGGIKAGRESAAAQVDGQVELRSEPPQSHSHTTSIHREKREKAEIVSVPMEDIQ